MRWRFFVSEALNSIRGNAATTLAATVTVLIVTFLMGIFVTTGWWVYHYAVEKRNEVTVKLYLPPEYASSADKRGEVANQVQRAAVREELRLRLARQGGAVALAVGARGDQGARVQPRCRRRST